MRVCACMCPGMARPAGSRGAIWNEGVVGTESPTLYGRSVWVFMLRRTCLQGMNQGRQSKVMALMALVLTQLFCVCVCVRVCVCVCARGLKLTQSSGSLRGQIADFLLVNQPGEWLGLGVRIIVRLRGYGWVMVRIRGYGRVMVRLRG